MTASSRWIVLVFLTSLPMLTRGQSLEADSRTTSARESEAIQITLKTTSTNGVYAIEVKDIGQQPVWVLLGHGGVANLFQLYLTDGSGHQIRLLTNDTAGDKANLKLI